MHPVIAQQLAAEHRNDLLTNAARAELVRQGRVARRASTSRDLTKATRRDQKLAPSTRWSAPGPE
jgi:hypothetical protein